MSVTAATAAAAYSNLIGALKPAGAGSDAGGIGGIGSIGGLSGSGGVNFADMFRQAAAGAIDTAQNAERVSSLAVAGKADLTNVVTAVSNMEVTMQTVTAVRDKVVAAYQEILKMPI